MRPKMNLIAALGANAVIGRGYGLPWYLPADLRRFRELTAGCVCVVGRTTAETLPILPGRTLVVVSRHGLYTVNTAWDGARFRQLGNLQPPEDGVGLAAALRLAAWLADGQPHYWIIGGAALYASTIDRADAMYLTHVHDSPPGDTWFPAINQHDWSRTVTDTTTEFTCATYHRRVAHGNS